VHHKKTEGAVVHLSAAPGVNTSTHATLSGAKPAAVSPPAQRAARLAYAPGRPSCAAATESKGLPWAS
jgi:hypothetical protein